MNTIKMFCSNWAWVSSIGVADTNFKKALIVGKYFILQGRKHALVNIIKIQVYNKKNHARYIRIIFTILIYQLFTKKQNANVLVKIMHDILG